MEKQFQIPKSILKQIKINLLVHVAVWEAEQDAREEDGVGRNIMPKHIKRAVELSESISLIINN